MGVWPRPGVCVPIMYFRALPSALIWASISGPPAAGRILGR